MSGTLHLKIKEAVADEAAGLAGTKMDEDMKGITDGSSQIPHLDFTEKAPLAQMLEQIGSVLSDALSATVPIISSFSTVRTRSSKTTVFRV